MTSAIFIFTSPPGQRQKTVRARDFENRENDGVLLVPKAGEMLFQLRQAPKWGVRIPLPKLGGHTPLEMIGPELKSPAPPPSPCTKVCTLDAQGFCAGCLRTGAEIGRWLSMSAAEQWQLIEELDARRARREPSP